VGIKPAASKALTYSDDSFLAPAPAPVADNGQCTSVTSQCVILSGNRFCWCQLPAPKTGTGNWN